MRHPSALPFEQSPRTEALLSTDVPHADKPSGEWRDHALCRDLDTDQFFPDDDDDPRAPSPPELAVALTYCDTCPVRHECLTEALARDEVGVWGGTTRAQREALTRGLIRARCPVCVSPWLRTASEVQVCLSCGVSWRATVRRTSGQRRRDRWRTA